MRPGFLIGEVGNGLRRNTSMVLAVVLVTMVSLFFLGSGLLAQRQVETLKGYWHDRVQVSIFMCTPDATNVASCAGGGVTEAQRDAVARDLEAMKPLVEEYWYESNAQAYERFREQFRNSPVLDSIPAESIPESYRVQLSDPARYEVVASAFAGAPGVESVEDQREVVDKLFTFLNAISISAVGLAAVMVVCAVLLISTTIRLTAWSRRRETTIMRLVGASGFTIHLPFIIETVVATLLGAGLAIGLLWVMVRFGIAEFLTDLLSGGTGMIGLIGPGDLWAVTPFLICGAWLLAIVTSWLSLRRHVRV